MQADDGGDDVSQVSKFVVDPLATIPADVLDGAALEEAFNTAQKEVPEDTLLESLPPISPLRHSSLEDTNNSALPIGANKQGLWSFISYLN